MKLILWSEKELLEVSFRGYPIKTRIETVAVVGRTLPTLQLSEVIQLKQGLKHFLKDKTQSIKKLSEVIQLKQGLKLEKSWDGIIFLSPFRGYPIKTRIETFSIYSVPSFSLTLSEVIQLKQGLKHAQVAALQPYKTAFQRLSN